MFVLLHFIDEGTEYNLKQYLYIPIYMYVNYRTALKLILWLIIQCWIHHLQLCKLILGIL